MLSPDQDHSMDHMQLSILESTFFCILYLSRVNIAEEIRLFALTLTFRPCRGGPSHTSLVKVSHKDNGHFLQLFTVLHCMFTFSLL